MYAFPVKISRESLSFIAAYNKAHNCSTYVIYTPIDSSIGGISAEFIGFVADNTVTLMRANGENYNVPYSQVEVHIAL